MERILPIFVTDGGEDWYDVADSGAKLPSVRTGKFSLAITGALQTKYITTRQLRAYRPQGKFFLSNDDFVSYCIAARHEKLTIIQFDWHMDLYGNTDRPCKSNFLRVLDREGLLEHIIFVGTRASEELIFHDHSRPVSPENEQFALKWRSAGTFDEVRCKVDVIPADSISSFEDGLEKAIKLAGGKPVGINIDLDVFEGVQGVQYNSKFADELEKFIRKREEWAIAQGREIDPERKAELTEYAEFARRQYAERGIPVPTGLETMIAAMQKSGEFLFFHITEYEDANDSGLATAGICNRLFLAAKDAMLRK